ncbi:phospholipase-like protein, partial [Tanacetum coccineum]
MRGLGDVLLCHLITWYSNLRATLSIAFYPMILTEASVEIARKNSPGLSFLTPNAKATSVCDDINEADAAADDNAKATSVHDDVGVPDAAADDNAKATSVHDDVGVPDAAADDNAKATSVCDDIDEADAAADDNAKATSVHDDVGVPDAAADDNAKATSVCDDINEADAAADDNAKATSVHDDVGVPDAAADDNAKATSVCDDINEADAAADDNAKKDTKPEVTVVKKTRKKRMSKRQRELPTSTRRRSKRHIQEVVSAADNGEVVKETQLLDSHEDVFQPRASKRMKKETLDSNAPKTRIHVLKEVLDYLNQAKMPLHWISLGGMLDVDEKFWQSLVARDATSRGFLTLLVYIPINILGIHWFLSVFKIRKGVVAFYDILSDKKPWDKEDRPWWIKFRQVMSKQLRKGMSKHGVFKQKNIHPKGYTITFTSPLNVPKHSGVYDDYGVWIQAWGNPVWTGVSDVLLPDPVLKHDAWVPEPVLKHVVPFIYELWVPTMKFIA